MIPTVYSKLVYQISEYKSIFRYSYEKLQNSQLFEEDLIKLDFRASQKIIPGISRKTLRMSQSAQNTIRMAGLLNTIHISHIFHILFSHQLIGQLQIFHHGVLGSSIRSCSKLKI